MPVFTVLFKFFRRCEIIRNNRATQFFEKILINPISCSKSFTLNDQTFLLRLFEKKLYKNGKTGIFMPGKILLAFSDPFRPRKKFSNKKLRLSERIVQIICNRQCKNFTKILIKYSCKRCLILGILESKIGKLRLGKFYPIKQDVIVKTIRFLRTIFPKITFCSLEQKV